MNIFNTTEDVVEGKYRGFLIVVGPGETKSVSDDAGVHILKKLSDYGLVNLNYGEEEEKKYGSLSNFKNTKKLEGLTAYLNCMKRNLSQEQMFPRENQQKNGGEVELSNTRIPHFKNKIKEIENLISEFNKEKVKNVNESSVKNKS